MRKPDPEHDASGFVLLTNVVPSALLEIRYFSTYNFVGERINGYEEPVALLTREAARALKAASIELGVLGYCLKVFDAYRPVTAVKHFMFWNIEDSDQRMKQYFYPNIDKTDVFNLGYISSRSNHSRGSCVDLTLFDMTTGKEVDMGGPFDLFDEISHPSYTGISEEQYENRMVLQNAMVRAGFIPYENEWWHFTLKDEPYPDRYFDFPVSSLSVRA